MILKEAFRYQNFLNTLIENATSYLNNADNTTKTIQTHKRNMANPNAKDEIVDVVVDREYDWSVEDILDFIGYVIDEKTILSDKIFNVKTNSLNNIDTMLLENKTIQRVLNSLGLGILRVKERNKVIDGTGFLINVNGEQVPYHYDIEENITFNFDKDKLDNFIRNLKKQSNLNSLEVEKLNVTLNLDFNPCFDITDTFEKCVNNYLNKYHK